MKRTSYYVLRNEEINEALESIDVFSLVFLTSIEREIVSRNVGGSFLKKKTGDEKV